MNAEKMFERIGYKKIVESDTWFRYESEFFDTTINFHSLKGHYIYIHGGHKYQDSGMIGVAEIKAIQKQIKELGWKDDTKILTKQIKENKDE